MNGSPAQIKWATEIRDQAVAELRKLALDIRKYYPKAAESAIKAAEALVKKKEAAWFIQKKDSLSVIAKHPAQVALPMTGWGGYSLSMLRNHPAFQSETLKGLGLKEEGRELYTAIHDLAENGTPSTPSPKSGSGGGGAMEAGRQRK